jgi:methionyl-tRNA formyltransferase
MRVVFAGTPEFAATALGALIDGGFTIALVLSQPDRPAGRGMKLVASPVKTLALQHGLDVATPQTLSLKKGGAAAEAAHAQLRAVRADVLVVAAYGLILPQAVLDIPAGVGRGLTAINIHASLLPRWRGAAPVARALEAGDEATGITLMQMDAGLDTGPMLAREVVAIGPEATAGSLTATLAALGARMIVDALRHPDELVPELQPELGVTYAHKLDKAEAWLDFMEPAEVLARRIRAFDPFPVASASWRETPLKLWAARASSVPTNAAAGTVVAIDAHGIHVATGEGNLCLTELQRAGGKRLPAKAFVAGTPLAVGDRFDVRRSDVRA